MCATVLCQEPPLSPVLSAAHSARQACRVQHTLPDTLVASKGLRRDVVVTVPAALHSAAC